MKISMVSEHASPLVAPGSVDAGGQNVHVAALAAALARRGHSVTVYTRRDDADAPERVALCDGVDVVHVNAGPAAKLPKDELLPHMGAFGAELGAAWALEQPDVVHSHFWMSGFAALEGADALNGVAVRPALVQTFHALGAVKRRFQGAADTSPPERATLEPLIGRQMDGVIATCPDEVAELRALGVERDRIEVAPCGVDLSAFGPDGEREERGTRFRLLCVGRLVPRKGVDLVIRALGLLRDFGFDDVELEVAGTGDLSGGVDAELTRLETLAAEVGVADRVHFRGQVPREAMPALLRSANATVCTPWYEPFGIVPLESMACGVPVIAAAVGGLQTTVLDGETGLHVPPRDPSAIAGAIARLLCDDRMQRSMSEAGRRRVETGYTWEAVAAQTERIYLHVLSRTRRPEEQLVGVTA